MSNRPGLVPQDTQKKSTGYPTTDQDLRSPSSNAIKAVSTLYWIAFYAVVKNTPAWCEQKWPKTAANFYH